MIENFKSKILSVTGASNLINIGVIQSLWSGYGKIVRYQLHGSKMQTVVVKHVHFPKPDKQMRGKDSDLSHKRKVRSYEVETAWYKQWSNLCDNACRIPKCFGLDRQGDEVLMVLEDMDAAGFQGRKSKVSWNEINACLSWLANFHATFMNERPTNLWKTGTYWHLATRPDELQVLTDKALKNAADKIDKKLSQSPFQTFVHGDAKLANFCFSKSGKDVAAVDFQYVGGGCGMKDVAYLLDSCLSGADCAKYEQDILTTYFSALRRALSEKNKPIDIDALEENWRSLYPYAWADFQRFLKGWSPGYWAANSYSERVTQKVLEQIKHEA